MTRLKNTSKIENVPGKYIKNNKRGKPMEEPNRYSLKMLAETMADAKWAAEIEDLTTEKWIALAISERAARVRKMVAARKAASLIAAAKGEAV